MAERRMFAKSIVLSDAFLDMPLSARCLYFTLGMMADDDGFIGSPKSIMRQCGASQDDMAILLQKRYVLAFESGVIVIKHWRMNNYLQNDRHKNTTYLEELGTLMVDKRGAYTEADKPCIQNVYTGKVRIGKDSINNIYSANFEEFWKNYPRKKEKANANKCYKARLKDGFSEDQLLEACINYAADCENTKREERYIKLGATFLSASTPFVDYLDENYTPASTSGSSQKPSETVSQKVHNYSERTYDYDELMKEMEGGNV